MSRTPTQLAFPAPTLLDVHDLQEQLAQAKSELAYVKEMNRQHEVHISVLQESLAESREAQRRLQLDLIRARGEQLIQYSAGSGLAPRWVEQDVLRLISLAHPDKWQDAPAATEITKELLALRDHLAMGGGQ